MSKQVYSAIFFHHNKKSLKIEVKNQILVNSFCWVFQSIILKWAKDKGISIDNPKSFAFLVARKIAREGTLLHRTGGRTDIYSREIPKTIENVLKRLGDDQVKEIMNIFINAEKVMA